MRAAHILNGWSPSGVIDRLPWSKVSAKPFRVWIFNNSKDAETEMPTPLGVMAQSLCEIKEKVKNYLKSNDGIDVETKELSVLRFEDGTSIIDDDYLLQMPTTDELLLLLPGQSWQMFHSSLSNEPVQELTEGGALLKRNGKYNCSEKNENSDFRYFVPTPKGQFARLTLDVYKEKPDETGCVRLTATTAGEAGLTVAYELRLNGVRAIMQYALRWTAVLLTYMGKVMTQSGEYLKERLN